MLLGVHSIKSNEKDSRQILKVKASYPHPSYDAKKKINDLMLLKVKLYIICAVLNDKENICIGVLMY